jgi:hypothetical protein
MRCMSSVAGWAAKQAAQSASSSSPQPVPELPTEDVQECKVIRTCKKKFHTPPPLCLSTVLGPLFFVVLNWRIGCL